MKNISINQIALNGEVCMKTILFDCDSIASGTPRVGYLRRIPGCCATPIEYRVTSDSQYATEANVLTGLIVNDKAGNEWLFDAASVAALLASCDACCGVTVAIVNVYNNVMPAYVTTADATFCITRSDGGTAADVQKATLAYMDKVSTLVHKTWAAGVSKYQVTAPASPKPDGTDTVAAGVCP